MSNAQESSPLIEGVTSEFSTFVLSLASSIMYHLGDEIAEGLGGEEPNLPLAKHTIDILCMLQTKTEGNLNAEESRLLSTLLYDLRMRYVKAKKGGQESDDS